MEVYKEMGNGFLESVYQECLAKEFQRRQIPYVTQPAIELTYKNDILQQTYKPDFVCYGKIIIELKVTHNLMPEHRAQLLNYLRATQMKVGYLINFGHFPLLEHERFIL